MVDNTVPTVASIVRQTPTSSPTNADSLTWRVTFSENVKNVDAADFAIGGTTASVTGRHRGDGLDGVRRGRRRAGILRASTPR